MINHSAWLTSEDVPSITCNTTPHALITTKKLGKGFLKDADPEFSFLKSSLCTATFIIVHEEVINNLDDLFTVNIKDDAINTAVILFGVDESSFYALRPLSKGSHRSKKPAIADATLLNVIRLRARFEETEVLNKIRDALPLILWWAGCESCVNLVR